MEPSPLRYRCLIPTKTGDWNGVVTTRPENNSPWSSRKQTDQSAALRQFSFVMPPAINRTAVEALAHLVVAGGHRRAFVGMEVQAALVPGHLAKLEQGTGGAFLVVHQGLVGEIEYRPGSSACQCAMRRWYWT